MNTAALGTSDERLPSGSDASARLAVGSLIQSRYLVRGVLGIGGFAVVYDAEHVGLGRSVAVKVMHLASDTPLALCERFRREARLSALADHPNVLEVYDTGTLPDGSPYLVMERVNGENLSHLLRRGPLSLAGAVEVVRQLLAGLCALEAAGIVHRDIKPDNLMLHDPGDGGPVVKLVDFGISKRIAVESAAKLTCHGALVGTPQYMSPEQIRGHEVDLRSDIYATGAVLYEVLTGHAPHESTSFSELVVAVLNAPLRPVRELRANCPAELERIATRALARSTSARYASPRAMLADLDACARELELPSGAAAFAYEDPVAPIWVTPARSSIPTLSRWWLRGVVDLRRPAQLAAGLLVLAVPGAALPLQRPDATVRAVAGVALHATGNPVDALPLGREPPPRWEAAAVASEPVRRRLASPLVEPDQSLAAPLRDAFASGAAAAPAVDAGAARAPSTKTGAPNAARSRKPAPIAAAPLRPAPGTLAKAPETTRPADAPVQPARGATDPAQHARWERAMDLALANMVRGRLVEAKGQYEAATRLDTAEPDAFRGLALVCARLGHGDEARSALHRYLTLAPDARDGATLRARVDAIAD